ncbi:MULTISPECIES: hypothetical protein [Streptomycetaceae]|nr:MULTISPECIES: hypothetical protein [Streptomycetaceae]MYS61168.1 hypothetical protein [Streptomyces sp. SID5468]CCB77015.1 protein of unknown function [Streptantibioticus cattleyicolor NRRL 8057 = DSM 46488]
MSDIPSAAFAVYRLLPSLSPSRGDYRTLLLSGSLRKIIRWQRSGSPEDRPTDVSAEWDGDPRCRPTEFPSPDPGAPVVSRRIADLLGEELLAAGSLLPLRIDGRETDDWLLYLVERVVDCIDPRRSSKPTRSGEIKKAVFRADVVPVELPAFRVPHAPGMVYWNGWAVQRLVELLGDDLEARLIWSVDPSLTPHPNPWGI